jgi:hypothetical protein
MDENYLYSAEELMDIPFTPTEIKTMKTYIDTLKNNIETDGENYVIVKNPSTRILRHLQYVLNYNFDRELYGYPDIIYKMSLSEFMKVKTINKDITHTKVNMAKQAPFGEEMNQALPPTEEEKKKATQDVLNRIIENE